jgi:hypothetical protein
VSFHESLYSVPVQTYPKISELILPNFGLTISSLR